MDCSGSLDWDTVELPKFDSLPWIVRGKDYYKSIVCCLIHIIFHLLRCQIARGQFCKDINAWLLKGKGN